MLIHQDLHPDKALRASREPWLVIDPKPVAGEREVSLAPMIRAPQLGWSEAAVVGRLDRPTSELALDRERARMWALGHAVAWGMDDAGVLEHHIEVARRLLGAGRR